MKCGPRRLAVKRRGLRHLVEQFGLDAERRQVSRQRSRQPALPVGSTRTPVAEIREQFGDRVVGCVLTGCQDGHERGAVRLRSCRDSGLSRRLQTMADSDGEEPVRGESNGLHLRSSPSKYSAFPMADTDPGQSRLSQHHSQLGTRCHSQVVLLFAS